MSLTFVTFIHQYHHLHHHTLTHLHNATIVATHTPHTHTHTLKRAPSLEETMHLLKEILRADAATIPVHSTSRDRGRLAHRAVSSSVHDCCRCMRLGRCMLCANHRMACCTRALCVCRVCVQTLSHHPLAPFAILQAPAWGVWPTGVQCHCARRHPSRPGPSLR